MLSKEELDKKEIKELDDLITKYRPSHKMYIRVVAVRDVLSGKTRTEVAKNLHVNRMTVGRWVNSYNEGGIDGLKPKYENCGLKCRLSDDQLLELKEILTNPNESYNLNDARKIIESRYGVKYSIKQVWVITREKLGLNYRKPFTKYHEAPKNAEDIFKKKQ